MKLIYIKSPASAGMCEFHVLTSAVITGPILRVSEGKVSGEIHGVIKANVLYFMRYFPNYTQNMTLDEIGNWIDKIQFTAVEPVDHKAARKLKLPTICILGCPFNSCKHVFPEISDIMLCVEKFNTCATVPLFPTSDQVEFQYWENSHMHEPVIYITKPGEVVTSTQITASLHNRYVEFIRSYKKPLMHERNAEIHSLISKISEFWVKKAYEIPYEFVRKFKYMTICMICNGKPGCRYMFPEIRYPEICSKVFEPEEAEVENKPEPVEVKKEEVEAKKEVEVKKEEVKKEEDYEIVPNADEDEHIRKCLSDPIFKNVIRILEKFSIVYSPGMKAIRMSSCDIQLHAICDVLGIDKLSIYFNDKVNNGKLYRYMYDVSYFTDIFLFDNRFFTSA